MLPTDLAAEFREMARLFREHEERSVARAYEKCADRVEEVLAEKQDTVLTLSEAAEESGYSSDHLGRLVREGTIPNAGKKGAPRIRRADLPTKAKRRMVPVAERSLARQVSNRQVVRSIIQGGP